MAIRSRKIVGAWRPKKRSLPVRMLLVAACALAWVALRYYATWGVLALLAVSVAGFIGYELYRLRGIRRRSYMLARLLGPGEVELGNGAVVTVTGTTGIYREGKRQITFTLPPPLVEGFPPALDPSGAARRLGSA